MTTLHAPHTPHDTATRRLRRLARRSLRTNPILRAATTPHGVTGYADAFRPAAGAGRIAATVEAITRRTHRAVSLTLRPHQPMAWAPGQHVLVTTEVDGVRLTRCYSLSDAAQTRTDGTLEITVAHLPEGRVSTHLTHMARVGETVGLSAPQGIDFVLDRVRPARLLLIGGGSGITPLRAMWRAMATEGLADRVCVLYYARTAADTIFAEELAGMGCAHVVHTRADDGLGRFDPSHLERFGIEPEACDAVYACGPVGLVEAVRTAWADRDLTDRLRTESFAPPTAPALGGASEGHLTFARSGSSAANDGRTLLEQAEAAGLTPEAGCRMGICHTCTTTKHAGVTRDIRSGTTDDSADCEIQLCVTAPVGDVALDL